MNILVIQNRMGIGDMVIFLPFVEAISKKYNTSVTLLIHVFVTSILKKILMAQN